MVDNGGIRGIIQMVHELGHNFDYAMQKSGGRTTSENMPANVYTRASLYPNGSFNADGSFTENDEALLLQMHPLSMKNGDSRGETFADIFVAWTFNVWNYHPENAKDVAKAKAWMP